jgi:hypothetical protein
MKKTALILLFLGFFTHLFAQEYGNEWIKYQQGKLYFKIPITKNGIYRLTYEELKEAKYAVGVQVHGSRYQLFWRGKEVAMKVVQKDPSIFTVGDYIEFYGQRNDGSFDTQMYPRPSDQPNKDKSLYSPTTFYYLTYNVDNDGLNTGKRMEEFYEQNTENLKPERFYTQYEEFNPTRGVFWGAVHPDWIYTTQNRGAIPSDWTQAKGYTDFLYINRYGIYSQTFDVDNVVSDTLRKPQLNYRITGRSNVNNAPWDLFIYLKKVNGDTLTILNKMGDYQWLNKTVTFDSTYSFPLNEGTVTVDLESKNTFSNNQVTGSFSVSYLRLSYPRAFDMENRSELLVDLEINANGKSYIEIENAIQNSLIYDITDHYNLIEIKHQRVGDKIQAIIPNTDTKRKLLVVSQDSIETAQSITLHNFRQSADLATYDYIIITDDELKKPSSSYENPVQAYADYRASAQGGSFRPLIITQDEIYDLFAYGQVTPQATRNFLRYMKVAGNPKFLFLIGKGLRLEYYFGFYSEQAQASARYKNFIPPYGTPSSDNALSQGLKGELPYTPSIPTGRLSARNSEHVENYLNKVIEHEQTPTDYSWRKNVLQLSGGLKISENTLFRGYIEEFGRVAEGEVLGANVTNLSKKTTDFVEYINISEEINNGVALLTLFGHASQDYTDVEIGKVTDNQLGYHNKGKYPMIVVNGCGSGNIFDTKETLGEDWILAKDRGAILFLSHGHVGIDYALRIYTYALYEAMFTETEFLGKSVGEIVQEVTRRFVFRLGSDGVGIAGAQQILLQGDPAVKLVFADKPDYHIDQSRVSVQTFNPQDILRPQSDSFQIKIDIANYGLIDSENKPISVRIQRVFNDGTRLWYPSREYAAIKNEESIFYTITTQEGHRSKANGINKFEVYIDYTEQIDEISEFNNRVNFEYSFQTASMLTIAPQKYSIVQNPLVNFVAQNTNTFSQRRDYQIQMDTSKTFDSPLLKDSIISAFVVPTWSSVLPVQQDSTVYYWRIRFKNPQLGENDLWAEASFVYIPQSPDGWSQSHFPQFDKSELSGIQQNEQNRQWEFKTFENNIKIKTVGLNVNPSRNYSVVINDREIVFNNCYINGVVGLAIDNNTGEVYNPLPELACGNSLSASFMISKDVIERKKELPKFISRLKEGDWAILFNVGNTKFSPDPLKQIGLRVDSTFTARSGGTFIVVGQKGAEEGTAQFSQDPGTRKSIELEVTISGRAKEGTIASTLVGPATEWTSASNYFRSRGTLGQNDSYEFDIYGQDLQGNQTLLYDNIFQTDLDISNLDANQYPFLQLKGTLKGETELTPHQLDRWQVVHKAAPEGVLLFDTLTYKENSILEIIEGEETNIGYKFLNVSGDDFKNDLIVRYILYNQNTNLTTTFYDTLSTLKAKETLDFSFKFSSLDFAGNNILTTYINPRLQAEQLYDNNVSVAYINVKPDDINPVLDVVFDGIHIMDGDIVSPQPVISISLKDDNQAQIKQDTVGMEIFLTACDTCSVDRISFDDAGVSWKASPDNDFKIDYQPSEVLADGVYTLSVQGEDVAGNKAGVEPYKINFEVINESAVTNFFPYPNPFSTNMRFVFTLTGNETPDELKIQIMTITGKVVRTILKDELGAIKVGNNVSEFAWDGTDQFGDQLANGVYLYKVSLRNKGQDFKKRETQADKLFKNNIGKIYLMR